MSNLIFLALERNVRSISFDFEKILNTAFTNRCNFIIWDLEKNKDILTVFCDEYNFENVRDNFADINIITIIPDGFKILDEIEDRYIKIKEKRDKLNAESQMKYDYQTYLKVKKMIESGDFKEPNK